MKKAFKFHKSKISSDEMNVEKSVRIQQPSTEKKQSEENVIDLVLAYRQQDKKNDMRVEFEQKLYDGGLILGTIRAGHLNFTTVSVGINLLKKYAEVLRLQMPLKLEVDEPKFNFFENFRICCLRICRKPVVRVKHPLFAEFTTTEEYLFDQSHALYFDSFSRINVTNYLINEIMEYTKVNENSFSLVYTAIFPLHDGLLGIKGSTRQKLMKEWASWRKVFHSQPIGLIRDYLGNDVASFFNLMGYQISMICIGIIIYIMTNIASAFLVDPLDFPDGNFSAVIYVCPICSLCDYKPYDYITELKTYISNSSVFPIYSILMSIWTVVYIYIWQRHHMVWRHRWGLLNNVIYPERIRSEFLIKFKNSKKVYNEFSYKMEPSEPLWRFRIPMYILGVVTLLVGISCILFQVVIMILLDALITNYIGYMFVKEWLYSMIPNFVLMKLSEQFFNKIFAIVTYLQVYKTESDHDISLSMKRFIFQYLNNNAFIFYIAFVKAMNFGLPGQNARYFGISRTECGPDNCIGELWVRIITLMILRLSWDLVLPYIKLIKNMRALKRTSKKFGFNDPFIESYYLMNWSNSHLHHYYLDLVIQFGFVSSYAILGPWISIVSLLKNMVKIRYNAHHILTYYRRPVPSIQIHSDLWIFAYKVISIVAVFITSSLSACTLTFIPKLVYYAYTDEPTKAGYSSFVLSKFAISDYPKDIAPPNPKNLTFCYYKALRYPPKHPYQYELTYMFWITFCIRMGYILTFVGCCFILQQIILAFKPQTTKHLQNIMKKEYYERQRAVEDHLTKRRAAEGDKNALSILLSQRFR